MKKILSCVLCLAMVLSMGTTALATSIDVSGERQDITLTYGVSQSFLVTIPTNINVDSSGKAVTQVVASNVMIEANKKLDITISGDDYGTTGSWELVNQVTTEEMEHRDYRCDTYNGFTAVNSVVSSTGNSTAGKCDWTETVSGESSRSSWEVSDTCEGSCTSTCGVWNTDEYGNKTSCASYNSCTARCTASDGCTSKTFTNSGVNATVSGSVNSTKYQTCMTWTASDGQTTSACRDSCSGYPSSWGHTFTHSETYDGTGSGNNMHYECSAGDVDKNGYCYQVVVSGDPSNTLTYTIGSSENGNDIVNDGVVLSVNAGDKYDSSISKDLYFTIIDDISLSGEYKDILTFVVAIVDVSNE